METVGDRIKTLRQKAKWNQKKLGIAVDVQPGTIGLWERGDRGVSIEYVHKINEAFEPILGDNLFWLLTGRKPEQYLGAFEVSNKYIAKEDVLSRTEDFLIKMDTLREIRIAGKLSEILEAYSSHVLGSDKQPSATKIEQAHNG